MVAGTCEGAVVLSWDQRLRLVMDAARGLVFLHGESISYQYLKSRNVLIFDGIRAKIKDVNLCCRNSDLSNSYPDSGLHLTTMAGAVTTTGRKYFNRVKTMAEAVKTMCVPTCLHRVGISLPCLSILQLFILLYRILRLESM